MKHILFISLLACLSLQSCYEDKGNYDYLPSNEVTINMNPPSTNAYLGETYSYTPEITFQNTPGANDFEYWWELVSLGTRNVGRQDVVSTGTQLNYLPRTTGNQGIQFCVKEVKTGVITRSSLTITAQAPYEKGWMILSKMPGNISSLSYVRPGYTALEGGEKQRTYTDFPDFYARTYPDNVLGTNPICIRQVLTGNSSNTTVSALYVLQDESVCLNGNSYAKEILMKDEFLGGTPPNFKPVDYYQGTYNSVALDASGKLYFRYPPLGGDTPLFTYQFPNFPMQYNGTELKADQLFPGTFSLFFGAYDKANKRILWIRGSLNGKGGEVLTRTFSPVPSIPEWLDVDALGNAEIIYAGSYQEFANNAVIFNLYQRDTAVYAQYFQAMSPASGSAFRYGPVTNTPFPSPELITPTTKYYNHRSRAGSLFLGVENKLYAYDITAKIIPAVLYYTFPAGETVVDMSTNPQESELGVITIDGGGNSFFYTFNVAVPILPQTTYIYRTTVPGVALDLEYKYASYAGYQLRTNAQYND